MTESVHFVRYQATQLNVRGIYVGIFGLANGLARSGRLSAEDYEWWLNANSWYDDAYPDPSSVDRTVYDRTANPHAQAWFKTSARHLLDRVPGYLELLARYNVDCEELRSRDPGRVLYEDDVQIVVSPAHPGEVASPSARPIDQ